MTTEKYSILSLILLVILSGSLYYNTVLVDTQAYVPSVYYLQGKVLGDDDEERVLQSYAFKRPMEIFAVSLIEPFVGIRQGYSFLNLILFVLASLLTYYYIKRLFANKENDKSEENNNHAELIGYISAVLFAVSIPLIVYATRVLVDVAGYLTIIVGLFAVDWVMKKEEASIANLYHHGAVWFLLGFFLLVRDAVIILFPYYCLMVLMNCWRQNHSVKKKFWHCAGIFSLIIFAFIPELFFMLYFDIGFLLSGKGAAITAGKYSLLGWLKFLVVHAAAFHIAYFFAYLGWKQEQGRRRKEFYLLYGLCAIVYLIGIQLVALTSPRFTMVLFPVLLPLAACGIFYLAERWKHLWPVHKTIICCILLYAVLSFIGAWLYPSRTLILEDAGGNAVISAVFEEIKLKLGVF